MKFTVSGGNQGANITLNERECGGILFVDVRMKLKSEEIPETFTVEWSIPDLGGYATLTPEDYRDHSMCMHWRRRFTSSRLSSNMPLHQIASLSGKNCITMAISDAKTPTKLQTGVCEFDGNFACAAIFFTMPTAPLKEYSATIRIDMRDVPYYESVYDVSDWWEKECGYPSAYVPDSAKKPMDSLWYSFHQSLNPDEVVNECKESVKLGMESVIIDDGWQTDDSSGGFAYCGDWQPSRKKVGNMAELVGKIHDVGMKVILWYSIPFVGIHSQKYEEFKDYFLDQTGDKETFFALDPRYKKVRDYLIGTYTAAVKNWNLDGLKLDFIDSFELKGKSLQPDPRRDYSSLEDGVDALMTGVIEALSKVNPEIMIEFRMSYVGPSIRKFGNMFRVGDCASDAVCNHANIINMRMTSGVTAIHSDMMMWSPEDSAENASIQIASALFGVPQISVRVDRMPETHRKMIKYYLDFWKAHRDVLLDGKLIADHPECQYTLARSILGDRSVIVSYAEKLVDVTTKSAVIVNISGESGLYIQHCEGKSYHIVNCMGDEIAFGSFNAEIEKITVPTGGMLFIGGK